MNRKRKLMQYLAFILSVILSVLTGYGAESTRVFDKSNVVKKDLYAFVRSLTSEDISDEFEADLNGDGRPECLMGVLCGNGGCQYYCFENMGDQRFKFIGSLFIHRRGFEILKTRHHGFSDILSYSHSSAASGSLTRYEFDGQKYRVKTCLKEVSSSLFELLRPTPIRQNGQRESHQIPPFNPPLPACQALSIGERYIDENKVDVSAQYIHSIRLSYDVGTKKRGHYWHIQWMRSTPKIGGEYGLRIYMDGTVLPEPCGP